MTVESRGTIVVLLRRSAEAGVLGLLFMLAFRFPAASGWGFLEAAMAFLFPALVFDAVFKGRNPGWLFLAFLAGFALLFHWVPATLEVKGPLPPVVAMTAALLLAAWEALGFLGVVILSRWAFRRSGPWAGAVTAALGIAAWEVLGFHVYPWNWGAALGGLPWLARSAAFVGAHGLSAWCWGCGALFAGLLASAAPARRILKVPGVWLALPVALSIAWFLLPRGTEKRVDVVMVQPNFEPGVRAAGMEQAMWARTDAILAREHLPHPGVATVVLWPESSVLGRDDRHPSLRLQDEALKRNVAWLFGTEGGALNLVRGEVAGRGAFLQGKVEPMPFGERMPGPKPVRQWLETHLNLYSQEPGELSRSSSFSMPTPQGELRIHPLICSEALMPLRVAQGLSLAGCDLLTNHTNDGWFEKSIATDLHAAQIRLRAVEAGVPLVRATLTGKSGLFREDGSWDLWGEPRSEGAYAFSLAWRPRWTPARSPWLIWGVLIGLGATTLVLVKKKQPSQAA